VSVAITYWDRFLQESSEAEETYSTKEDLLRAFYFWLEEKGMIRL
jgi:hypothetical protein